jgi:hypothetical protein
MAHKPPSWELPEATELLKLMHNKYAQLLRGFSLGIIRREYQDYLWNRNQKSGFKSDDSNDSTPSVKATGDASKIAEEYLEGGKAATKVGNHPSLGASRGDYGKQHDPKERGG